MEELGKFWELLSADERKTFLWIVNRTLDDNTAYGIWFALHAKPKAQSYRAELCNEVIDEHNARMDALRQAEREFDQTRGALLAELQASKTALESAERNAQYWQDEARRLQDEVRQARASVAAVKALRAALYELPA